MPAASAANKIPKPVGSLIDSKYVGKITVSIGMYKPDRNMKPIASANNGLSFVNTSKPSRNEVRKGSWPSSRCATVLPCSSSTRMNSTASDASANVAAVTANPNIGPLQLMQAEPMAGPTIQPMAKIPSCRPFAASMLMPDAVAALGMSALRAVYPAGSKHAPITAITKIQR